MATKKELKEMIVQLQLRVVKLSIPDQNCPYALYEMEKPKEACEELTCNECSERFMNEIEKVIRDKVEKL